MAKLPNIFELLQPSNTSCYNYTYIIAPSARDKSVSALVTMHVIICVDQLYITHFSSIKHIPVAINLAHCVSYNTRIY